MAKTHSKNSVFKVGTTDLSAWTTNVEWPMTGDTAETSAFGSTAKTYVRGLTDATITISGQYDAATGGPDVTLQTLVDDATTTTVIYQPDGPGTGKIEYTAGTFATTYTPSSDLGGVVAYAAEFQVSGVVTRTVLA